MLEKCKKAEILEKTGALLCQARVSVGHSGEILLVIPRSATYKANSTYRLVFYDPVLGRVTCRCRLSAPLPLPGGTLCSLRCEVMEQLAQEQRRQDVKIPLKMTVMLHAAYQPGDPMRSPEIGIPATIDNDIGCSHYTIGFDTACNTAIECIDKLRDTMQSHERCSVVEVMGRHAGYLALSVGISVGATAVLIPERELNFEQDIVDKIRRARLAGTTHYMVVVAEGAGSTTEISQRIHEEVGIDPRVTVLGHIQRGGSPSAKDRETASCMGYNAVQAIAEHRGNCVVATQDGRLTVMEMEEALKMKKTFHMERYQILESLINNNCGLV